MCSLFLFWVFLFFVIMSTGIKDRLRDWEDDDESGEYRMDERVAIKVAKSVQ